MLLEILTPPLLSLMNRVRGGLFGDQIRKLIPFYGTTVSRILYGLVIVIPVYLATGEPILASLLILTTYLRHATLGFSPFQYMQTSTDLGDMTIRGGILTGYSSIAVIAYLGILPSIVIILTGLIAGPTYLLAQKAFTKYSVDVRNEIAEVLYGFLTGVGYVIAGSL